MPGHYSFTIWHLRSSYLSSIKDGVGDRLININSSILNTPGFRAAGWSSYANAAHIKRTYSPPIPTATAVASEYFQLGSRGNYDVNDTDNRAQDADTDGLGVGFGVAEDGDDDDEEGGIVTGTKDSSSTVGPRQHKRSGGRKTRRKEKRQSQEQDSDQRSHHLQRNGDAEDEDSSDLSDESDEDNDGVQK